MDNEKKAIELSDKSIDDMQKFVKGFGEFVEKKKILHKKEIIEMYSKVNLATLIYNALILKEELQKRINKQSESD